MAFELGLYVARSATSARRSLARDFLHSCDVLQLAFLNLDKYNLQFGEIHFKI